MSGAAAPLILGFLLATAYGAAFHLILGGPLRRILFYLLAAWLVSSSGRSGHAAMPMIVAVVGVLMTAVAVGGPSPAAVAATAPID